MKRLIASLLCLVICISMLTGCGTGKEKAFQAGYGKVDISPEAGVSLGSYGNADTRLTKGVWTPLEAVAIALTDGEDNTLILVVTDVSWGNITRVEQIRAKVSSKLEIPKENIIVGGTHNHSAPDMGYDTNPLNAEYVQQWEANVISAIEKAMADRKPATMEVGSTETEDMVFSRRYLCDDGLYMGGGPSSYNTTKSSVIVDHETEADEEIQMVKFVREDAKDILITQWQSHACNINWDRNQDYHYMASGEWPQVIRSTLESELDVHCMYMQGAAGNLACMSRIEGENLSKAESDPNTGTIGYNDFQAIVEKIASYVIDTYQKEDGFKKVATGLIQTNQYKMPVNLREGKAANEANKPELNTVAIGDLSLVTLPSELFDSSAKEVKDTTPFEMTLIMGYTCGAWGYEAPDWAIEHGCYEVDHGRLELGTADKMMDHYIDTLNELHKTK